MLFEIGFLMILVLGGYLVLCLIAGLYVSWQDYKRYKSNKWLLENLALSIILPLGIYKNFKRCKNWYFSRRQRETRSFQSNFKKY
jgi:putative effector of murein hydrolase